MLCEYSVVVNYCFLGLYNEWDSLSVHLAMDWFLICLSLVASCAVPWDLEYGLRDLMFGYSDCCVRRNFLPSLRMFVILGSSTPLW